MSRRLSRRFREFASRCGDGLHLGAARARGPATPRVQPGHASPARPRGAAAVSLRVEVRVFTAVALSALAVAALARLRLDPAATLWLDESWTGAFASQPTFAALAEQVRDDANAPVYYALIWAWAQVFGVSNAALHIPSEAMSMAAPAIAWMGFRRSHPILALTWAVLLATWLPGIDQADEARCYPLLYASAVLSTLAHHRLLRAPSLRRAAAWSACAAFMTLVHYYAGVLALCQGLTLLALHRGRALRLWPGALPFVPAFAWIAWHAPRLAAFARPGVAWYDVLPVADLPAPLIYLLGGPLGAAFLLIALLIEARSRRGRRRAVQAVRVGPGDRDEAALWWVGAAALAAVALCLGVATLRPTFTGRYLTPFVPGVSLLAAAGVLRSARSPSLAATALVGGSLATVTLIAAMGPSPWQRIDNFEVASAWLAEARPTRLVFLWDNPSTAAETRGQLDAIGGFFLRRAGLPLAVTPLYPTAPDMNGPVLAEVGRGVALLWMYDTLVHDTTARVHPPRLSALGPGLECRDFGELNIGVVACRQPWR